MTLMTLCMMATGAVLLVFGAPMVINFLGFGTGGIGAGSFGAKLMSLMSPVGKGGLVAILQSIGAAGFGPAGIVVLIIAGAGCCLLITCL